MNWDMLGHEWAIDFLSGQITRTSLHHAYLFTGPAGVGRRTLALRFAQAINCTSPPAPGGFCGRCRACRGMAEQAHPDLVTVESEAAGAVLKVEQIRDLHRFLSLAPYEAATRVALLLRFEEAQRHAANALLKTLEEPSDRVLLMLTAESPEHLPETILSRCQLIRLRPLPVPEFARQLAESRDLPAEQASLLAHLSGGRPGIALRYLDDSEKLAERQAMLDDQSRLLPADRIERFKFAEDVSADKARLRDLLEIWSGYWRDVLILSAGAGTPLTNPDRTAELQELARRFEPAAALQMLGAIEKTRQRIDRNANTRLAAENLMLNMPHV